MTRDGVTADGVTADGVTADGVTADGETSDGEGGASVTFLCPQCESEVTAVELQPVCACGARIRLHDSGGFPTGPVTSCAVCDSEALYIAKDFNKNLGVAIVALGCIGFFWGALAGITSLVLLTLLDRLVYYLRPLVTVCYACKAVYRGIPLHPAHKPYELMYDETFEGSGQRAVFEPADVPPRED